MIVFDYITVQNIMSYGNAPTTINLRRDKNTMVVGRNGHGKSVILTEGICFACYGRPYRNINRGQLVNSINQKGMMTELGFTIGSKTYKIRRGIKPNIFEIYIDGKLVEQEAAVRDYQGFLENQILKMNFKTFCQVVILGTASYVPFMLLNPYQRREVIEDVLDISVFSTMNLIHKNRVTETNDGIKDIAVAIDLARKDTVSQQRIIKVLEEARDSRVAEEQANIESYENDITELEADVLALKESQKDIVCPASKPDAKVKSDLTIHVNRLDAQIESLEKSISKLEKLGKCPTCHQEVGAQHKHTFAEEVQVEVERLKRNLSVQQSQLDELVAADEAYDAYRLELVDLQRRIQLKETDISTKRDSIQRSLNVINMVKKNSGNITAEKEKLKNISKDALDKIKAKTDLLLTQSIQSVATNLLKDSGIKAAIVKEYLPILNKLINKYLGAFGFFVNFELDENFNETIKSRGRDEFTYASFSEGEKRRIDVAILFAFRQISEMKNSANCSLLVLDEIAESAFDLVAREAFTEILSSLDGTNCFVISHSAPNIDSYDAVMKVEKKGDFSTVTFVN